MSSHCLLQVTHILHPLNGTIANIGLVTSNYSGAEPAHSKSADGSQQTIQNLAFIVVAGTDGNLTLWDITATVVSACLTLNISVTDSISDSDSCFNESRDDKTDDMVTEFKCFDDCESVKSSSEDEEKEHTVEEKCCVEVTAFKPSCTIKAHQCGVNALAVRRVDCKYSFRLLFVSLACQTPK
jgi:hypothetical protein